MDPKKLAGAVVVGYVLIMGLGYVIHNIWLRPDYEAYAGVWRLEEAMRQKLWIIWLGNLLFTAVFVWVYTRGVENKAWVGQGIRYGILMTLLAVVPTVFTEYVVFPIPYTIALKWILAGAVQLILLGLVVAGFLKPAS